MKRRAVCDVCSQPYYRRNVVEGWTAQNPGHRVGWVKNTLRICTYCQPAAQTSRALMYVEARIVKRELPRKRQQKQA